MDSRKQSAFSLPARKVYHPSPRQYLKFEVLSSGVFPSISFGLLFFVIVGSPIWNGHPEYLYLSLPLSLIFLGPLEVFFVFYLLWRTHLRLVTSAEGIEYSTVGFRIFSPWDNISALGTRQENFSTRGASWTQQMSGLELRQSAPRYKASSLVRLFMKLHSIERPSFFIPIGSVVKNWQDTVAQDMQHYAPQLTMRLPYFRGSNVPDVKQLLKKGDIEGLIAALTDPADEIRETAATNLGYSQDRRGVEPLIAALQDIAYRVRAAAADALGYLRDTRAINPLIQAILQERDPAMLKVAARALGQIGDMQAVEVLLAIAQNQHTNDAEATKAWIELTLRTLRQNAVYHEEIQKAATAALKQIKSAK